MSCMEWAFPLLGVVSKATHIRVDEDADEIDGHVIGS